MRQLFSSYRMQQSTARNIKCSRRSGRVPLDKVCRELYLDTLMVRLLDREDQCLKGSTADLDAGRTYGREGWLCEARKCYIVKSDYGDIARYVQPRGLERLYCAESHQI